MDPCRFRPGLLLIQHFLWSSKEHRQRRRMRNANESSQPGCVSKVGWGCPNKGLKNLWTLCHRFRPKQILLPQPDNQIFHVEFSFHTKAMHLAQTFLLLCWNKSTAHSSRLIDFLIGKWTHWNRSQLSKGIKIYTSAAAAITLKERVEVRRPYTLIHTTFSCFFTLQPSHPVHSLLLCAIPHGQLGSSRTLDQTPVITCVFKALDDTNVLVTSPHRSTLKGLTKIRCPNRGVHTDKSFSCDMNISLRSQGSFSQQYFLWRFVKRLGLVQYCARKIQRQTTQHQALQEACVIVANFQVIISWWAALHQHMV